MRAKEFVVNVNVPVTIKINGDGQPEIDMGQGSDGPADPSELKQDPPTNFIPPLQQQIELQKWIPYYSRSSGAILPGNYPSNHIFQN